MDPLLRQLRELPGRLAALPSRLKLLLGAGVAVAVLVGGVFALGRGEGAWEYAFTSLSAEDSAEMAQLLKGAGVPYRLEAGGAALAVPVDKVYDARLLLAAAGLPRAGGTGFELFDQGDLGVSEFTLKVNLRRALEGELARTIGRLSSVRSARVHLTLRERGLYRDDDRPASAAVVLNLRGATPPGERELAGIRHLAASAVPGLLPEGVTIVDGRGSVLAADTGPTATASNEQRAFERDLEQRLTGLLEPVVGAGAVVARVSSTFDTTEVQTNAEVVDPDLSAVRSERHLTQGQSSENGADAASGSGAVANQPLQAAPTVTVAGQRTNATTEDATTSYEVSKTTTTSVARIPRLRRLSIAILLDGADGKPRLPEEVTRLGELAKRAAGFDAARGDQFEISSAPFARSTDEEPATVPAEAALPVPVAGVGLGVLAVGIIAVLSVARRRRDTTPEVRGEREPLGVAASALPPLLALPQVQPSTDPDVALRERARELVEADPRRAARLLRAWLARDVALPAAKTTAN